MKQGGLLFSIRGVVLTCPPCPTHVAEKLSQVIGTIHDKSGMMYDCATVARKGGIVDLSRRSDPDDSASHLLDAHVGSYLARERCPKKIPPRVNIRLTPTLQ